MKKILSTLLLVLVLSAPALAGDIEIPGVAKSGDIEIPSLALDALNIILKL